MSRGLNPGVPKRAKRNRHPLNYNRINELEDIINNNNDVGIIVMEPIRNHEPENNFLGKGQKNGR